MRQGDISNWRDIPSCTGLLFFAELVTEMVCEYSIPVNRIVRPSVHQLCDDAIQNIKLIESKKVNSGSFSTIVEELFYALKNDSVKYLKNAVNYFIKNCNGEYKVVDNISGLNFEETKNAIYGIKDTFFVDNKYYGNLREEVVDIVVSNSEARFAHLYGLTRSLLSELIYRGYSPRYILYVVNQVFWNADEVKIPHAQIENFFNKFSWRKETYEVLFYINKKQYNRANDFLGNLKIKEDLTPKNGSREEKRFLDAYKNKVLLSNEVESLDPYFAIDMVRKRLSITLSIYKLFNHDFEYEINKVKSGVYRGNEFLSIPSDKGTILHVKKFCDKSIEKKQGFFIKALTKIYDKERPDELVKFIRMVTLHSNALESSAESNQLLDLWAIFEALLNIDDNKKEARITQVIKIVLPIVQRGYIESLFSQLSSEIEDYSLEDYSEIIDGASGEFECLVKVAEFVILDEKKEKRNCFLSKCNEYPLLKERILYYNKEMKTKEGISKMLDRNANRVKWDIERAYRNRNLIIHNGAESAYLSLLVETLCQGTCKLTPWRTNLDPYS